MNVILEALKWNLYVCVYINSSARTGFKVANDDYQREGEFNNEAEKHAISLIY